MTFDRTLKFISDALDRDDRAPGLLLERLRARMELWCVSRMSTALRTRLSAEQMAQEVLEAIDEARSAFEGDDAGAFLAWAFRLGEARVQAREDGDPSLGEPPAPRAFSGGTLTRSGTRIRMTNAVRRALGTLSDPHREIIRLRRIEERSVEDLAAALDVSEEDLIERYWTAMRALARAMCEEDVPTEETGAADSRSPQ